MVHGLTVPITTLKTSFSGTGIAEGLIQKGPESISKTRRKISDKQ